MTAIGLDSVQSSDLTYGCLFTLQPSVALEPVGLKVFNIDAAEFVVGELLPDGSRYGVSPPGYLVDCTVLAGDLDEAVSRCIGRLHFLAGTIAVSTGTAVLPPQIIFAVDCSQGSSERAFRQYFTSQYLGLPSGLHCDVLDKFMRSTIAVDASVRGNIGRATRWLWKALMGDDPIDQFIWLWNGLETIAEALSACTSIQAFDWVSQRCSECGAELSCQGCGRTTFKRATNAAIIENWAEHCGYGGQRKKLNEVRNGIFHGFMSVERLYGRCMEVLPTLAVLLYQAIIQVSGADSVPEAVRNLSSILPVGVGSVGYIEGVIRGWIPGKPIREYPLLTRELEARRGEGQLKLTVTYRNNTGHDIEARAHAVSGPEGRMEMGPVTVSSTKR